MSREEMNAVLSEAVKVACYFLQKRGEFFPFAVGMDQAGGLRHIQGWTGDESPPSNEILDLLQRGLARSAGAGEFDCTGLVSDVRISTGVETTDAIRVQVEHRDEQPVVCYVPYRLTGGSVITDEIVAEPGVARVFLSHGAET